jgi:hypothetical protein
MAMTPNQLYASKSIEPDNGSEYFLEWLVGSQYTHVPEVTDQGYCGPHRLPPFDPDGRVETRVHAELYFDSRRSNILRSVWFDELPVMVCINAGREGDDYSRRWVTDAAVYDRMCIYLRSILIGDAVEIDQAVYVDGDTEQPNMTDFYGHSLASHIGEFRRYPNC